MNTALGGNIIVITGGASGIGLALTKRLLKDNNTVIAVGRRLNLLEKTKSELNSPLFHIHASDVESEPSRISLFKNLTKTFPNINILINNAGIQKTVDATKPIDDWKLVESEILINLSAPIHLSLLFSEYWRTSGIQLTKPPVIANVTSGLSFVPLSHVPVYCATKAGLHSFTWSLRHQLKDTPIRVVEIIPPAVDTDLQSPGLHTFGVNVDEFADAVYDRIRNGKEVEVGYGMSEKARTQYRSSVGPIFDAMNK